MAPAVAFAQTPPRTNTTGPVHAALQGPTVDPYGPVLATSLRIDPPKRGMVMVYQNGKLKGLYSQSSWLPAADDGVYGVVAMRGKKVLFNANVVARPGVTTLAWGSADAPTITYTPAMRPLTSGADLPRGVNVHHHVSHDGSTGMTYVPGMGLVTRPATQVVLAPQAPRAGASTQALPVAPSALMGRTEHRVLLRDLESRSLDTARLSVLRQTLSSLDGKKLTAAQTESVVARFKTADGQVVARQTLAPHRR